MRARDLPVKSAAVSNTLPPVDHTIFEIICLDEPPRAAFKPSTVTESFAYSSHFDKSDTHVLDVLSNQPTSTSFN